MTYRPRTYYTETDKTLMWVVTSLVSVTIPLCAVDSSVESENCVNRELFWLLIHANVIANSPLIKGLEN